LHQARTSSTDFALLAARVARMARSYDARWV
jgi:hypothetical protein